MDIPEDVMRSALSSMADKAVMTRDEADKFSAAMKDEEFRNALMEYMQEISNPEARAEQEAYIRQMEDRAEVPEGMVLIRPTAGFAIKTRTVGANKAAKAASSKSNAADKGDKVFINIVSSDRVDMPTLSGRTLNLPHILSPPRQEFDAKHRKTATIDVCVHPKTIEDCKKSEHHKRAVAAIAVESVGTKYAKIFPSAGGAKCPLDTETFSILKSVSCVGGTPAVLQLKESTLKAGGAEPGTKDAASAAGKLVTEVAGGSTTGKQSQPAHSGTHAHSHHVTPSSSKAVTAPSFEFTEEGALLLPPAEVTVVERSNVSLSPHQDAPSEMTRPLPPSLLLRLSLPLLPSARLLDCSVHPRHVDLVCQAFEVGLGELRADQQQAVREKHGAGVQLAQVVYRLHHRLPYEVLHEAPDCTAKYLKESKVLQLTLPVKQPEPQAVAPAHNSLIQEVDAGSEASEGMSDAGMPSESAAPKVVDVDAAHSRWIKQRPAVSAPSLPTTTATPAAATPQDKSQQASAAAASSAETNESSASKSSKRTIPPFILNGGVAPYRWQQTEDSVIILLDVPWVRSAVAEGTGVEVHVGASQLTAVVTAAAEPSVVTSHAAAMQKDESLPSIPRTDSGARPLLYKYALLIQLYDDAKLMVDGVSVSDDNVVVVLEKTTKQEWPTLVATSGQSSNSASAAEANEVVPPAANQNGDSTVRTETTAPAASSRTKPSLPVADKDDDAVLELDSSFNGFDLSKVPNKRKDAVATTPQRQNAFIVDSSKLTDVEIAEGILLGKYVRGKSGVLYDAQRMQKSAMSFVMDRPYPVHGMSIG